MNQLAPEQSAHPAAVAQEFMRRSDMKGGEVEAYVQTFNWLQTFLTGETVATPKEAHFALLEELKELREYRRKTDEAYARAEAEEAARAEAARAEAARAEPEPVDDDDDIEDDADVGLEEGIQE